MNRDPNDVLVERTDNRWLAHWPEFVDLQVSEHARGDTEEAARRNLLARTGPDYMPATTPEMGPEPQPM